MNSTAALIVRDSDCLWWSIICTFMLAVKAIFNFFSLLLAPSQINLRHVAHIKFQISVYTPKTIMFPCFNSWYVVVALSLSNVCSLHVFEIIAFCFLLTFYQASLGIGFCSIQVRSTNLLVLVFLYSLCLPGILGSWPNPVKHAALKHYFCLIALCFGVPEQLTGSWITSRTRLVVVRHIQ